MNDKLIKTYSNTVLVNTTVISLLILLTIAFYGCDKAEEAALPSEWCGVQNPIKEVAWLKEAIEAVENDEYSYYASAIYQNAHVVYYGNCNPAINYVSFVLDCSGNNLGNTNDLYEELSDIEILWKPPDSQCVFYQ